MTTIREQASDSLTPTAVRDLFEFTGVFPRQLAVTSFIYFTENCLHFRPALVPLIDNEHFVHGRVVQVHGPRYVLTAMRLP